MNARVDDVVLTDRGAMDSVIVTAGGFFGVAGDDAVVPTRQVTFFRDAEGVRVSTPLTQEQLDERAEAREGRDIKARPANDPTLAGWSLEALLGAAVDTADTENTARIDDVLFNNDGEATYVVTRSGGVTGLNGAIGLGGDLHVVRYSDLTIKTRDNELDVDLMMSNNELTARPRMQFTES